VINLKKIILLILIVVSTLMLGIGVNAEPGDTCTYDSDCEGFETCADSVCTIFSSCDENEDGSITMDFINGSSSYTLDSSCSYDRVYSYECIGDWYTTETTDCEDGYYCSEGECLEWDLVEFGCDYLDVTHDSIRQEYDAEWGFEWQNPNETLPTPDFNCTIVAKNQGGDELRIQTTNGEYEIGDGEGYEETSCSVSYTDYYDELVTLAGRDAELNIEFEAWLVADRDHDYLTCTQTISGHKFEDLFSEATSIDTPDEYYGDYPHSGDYEEETESDVECSDDDSAKEINEDCRALYESRFQYTCEDGLCEKKGRFGLGSKVMKSGSGFGKGAAGEEPGFLANLWDKIWYGS
jgi:hypothetical protein